MRQNAMPTTTCSEKLLYKNLELDPKSEETDKQIQAWAHLHAESNVCPGFIIILFGCFNCQTIEKVRALIFSIMLLSSHQLLQILKRFEMKAYKMEFSVLLAISHGTVDIPDPLFITSLVER